MQSSRKMVWQSCQSNGLGSARKGQAEGWIHMSDSQPPAAAAAAAASAAAVVSVSCSLSGVCILKICRKYSTHIAKLFNKLNAANERHKDRQREKGVRTMVEKKTKAESQKLLQAKKETLPGGPAGPAGAAGPVWGRAGQKSFPHRDTSFFVASGLSCNCSCSCSCSCCFCSF